MSFTRVSRCHPSANLGEVVRLCSCWCAQRIEKEISNDVFVREEVREGPSFPSAPFAEREAVEAALAGAISRN